MYFLFSLESIWHFLHRPSGNPRDGEILFSLLLNSCIVFPMKLTISALFSLQFHPLIWYCKSWEVNSNSFKLLGPLVLMLFSLMHVLLIWQKKQLLSVCFWSWLHMQWLIIDSHRKLQLLKKFTRWVISSISQLIAKTFFSIFPSSVLDSLSLPPSNCGIT